MQLARHISAAARAPESLQPHCSSLLKLWPVQRAAAAAAAAATAAAHRRGGGGCRRGWAAAAATTAAGEGAAAAGTAALPTAPGGTAAVPDGSGGGGAIYSSPQLYDDAFSYRDFGAEAKFLLGAYARHASGGDGKPPGSVLELGCGPANHALQLAKRGVRAWALDSSAAMLEFAAQKAAAAGAKLATLQGDMMAAEVPGMLGRFDLALCLLGTLSHALTNADAAAVLRNAARHLRPGGLFVVELAHPGDLFDGSLLLNDAGAEMWEVERAAGAGGRKILVTWGTDADDFDPETQVLRRTVAIHAVHAGTGERDGAPLLEEVVPYRQFTLQEVGLLAAAAGLELAATYGDLAPDVVGLRHEDAYRMVAVLRKPASAAAAAAAAAQAE